MRIAINTRFLLAGRLEGFGWYTHEIVRRMVQKHPEHQFLFIFDRPYDPSFIYGKNVEAVVVSPPARHPILFYIWYEWRLPAVLKKWKADVLFSPDAHLSIRAQTPTLLTIHDLIPLQMPDQLTWVQRTYYRYFLPRFLHRADGIVTISEYVKGAIVGIGQQPFSKVKVIYNGCREIFGTREEHEKEDVREQYSEGQPFFFYTGAIHPRKNILRLIEAFDIFKEKTGSPVKLVLAGRFAWKTGAVKKGWEQSAHRNDIVFTGYLPDVELPRLMAAALAFVYPSLSEGFGLPVLEAMHAETPVITSNTTALPEVAGDAALLVNPEDTRSISEALLAVWSNESLRNELINKGRIQREKFDWTQASEAVMEALVDLGKK